MSSQQAETEAVKFDIAVLVIDEGDCLRWTMGYAAELFDEVRMKRMAGHLQTVLQAMVSGPERRVGELPLLTEAEREQAMVEWNATQADYGADYGLGKLLQRQADKTPDAVAVVYEELQLTYEGLELKANQLGHYLRGVGVVAEQRVGILMQRSAEMVVALIGVMKAGGAYVPIDPDYPAKRVAYMLRDAEVKVLLTQEGLVSRIGEGDVGEAIVISVDSQRGEIEECSRERVEDKTEGENLAYVIYTVGSTGRAEGSDEHAPG